MFFNYQVMIKNIFKAVFIFLPLLSFAQTSKIVSKMFYLDSQGQTSTEEDYNYYRIVRDYGTEKELYVINDYYKSGVLRMTGTSTDKDILKREGLFIFFDENGIKNLMTTYKQGFVEGKEFSWYEDGNKKQEAEYIYQPIERKNLYKINQFWDKNKNHRVIDGNGLYTLEEKDNQLFGKIVNGLRDSVWTGKKNNIKFTEIYKSGQFQSGTSIDSTDTKYNYTEFQTRPIPAKGMSHFTNYLASNIKRTDNSNLINLSGRIVLEFTIEKDGRITNIKVIKGIGYGMNEEVVKVLSKYPKWIPAKSMGIPYKVQHTIPIVLW